MGRSNLWVWWAGVQKLLTVVERYGRSLLVPSVMFIVSKGNRVKFWDWSSLVFVRPVSLFCRYTSCSSESSHLFVWVFFYENINHRDVTFNQQARRFLSSKNSIIVVFLTTTRGQQKTHFAWQFVLLLDLITVVNSCSWSCENNPRVLRREEAWGWPKRDELLSCEIIWLIRQP